MIRKHLPVSLSGNVVMVYVNAASSAIAVRSGLKYYCEIQVPKAYLSGEYVVLETLQGSEAPPRTEGYSTIYDGWSVNIAQYLDAKLDASVMPDVDKAWWLEPNVIMPYRTRTWVTNNGVLVPDSEVLSPILYVMKGKMNEDDFVKWGEQLCTTYMDAMRPFLSWQPMDPKLASDAPVFLSFLTNYDILPTKLTVKAEVDFVTAASERVTVSEILDVANFAVYNINAKLDLIKPELVDQATAIRSWEIWLEDEDGVRLTEKRRYFLETRFEPFVNYVVFLNGLSGWDAIRMRGKRTEKTNIKAITGEKEVVGRYETTDVGVFVSSKYGQKVVQLGTGPVVNIDWMQYYEDMLWSERIFVIERGQLVSVNIEGELQVTDDDWLGERGWEFSKSKNAVGFSAINKRAVSVDRATVWVADQEYCLVNANGMRTGLAGWAVLKQVYADNGALVPGVGLKNNVPGTEGYVAPVASAGCAASTTPFKNAAIVAEGNYFRTGCGSGFAGTKATITIGQNTYGSDRDLEDANKKALAAWKYLDTQAYADQFGSCVIPSNAGIRAKFWNYVGGIFSNGPVFDFSSTPLAQATPLNANMNGFAATYPSVSGVVNDRLLIEYNGYLKGPITGNVVLTANVDDGVRVWVDDILVIDSWAYNAGMTTNLDANVGMTLDGFKKIKVQYYSFGGFAGLTLSWAYTGQSKVVVPNNRYFYV